MTNIKTSGPPASRGEFTNQWILFLLLGLAGFIVLGTGAVVLFRHDIPSRLTPIVVISGVVASIGGAAGVWLHRAAFVSLSWDETSLVLRFILLPHVPVRAVCWSDIRRIGVLINGEKFATIAIALQNLERMRAVNKRPRKLTMLVEGDAECITVESTMFPEAQLLEILGMLQSRAGDIP